MEIEMLESSPVFFHSSQSMSLSAQASQQADTTHANANTDYKIIAKFGQIAQCKSRTPKLGRYILLFGTEISFFLYSLAVSNFIKCTNMQLL